MLLLGSCLQDQRPGKILVCSNYFVGFVSGNNQLLLKLISLLLGLKQDISSITNSQKYFNYSYSQCKGLGFYFVSKYKDYKSY